MNDKPFIISVPTSDMTFVPLKFRNDKPSQSDNLSDGQNLEAEAFVPNLESLSSVEVNVDFESNENAEIGLDRVPTRLSNSDVENRRNEEESGENVQNLVEEMLNSTSSEVDFIVGNTDNLPSPK